MTIIKSKKLRLTNGDKIRPMKYDELAKFLMSKR